MSGQRVSHETIHRLAHMNGEKCPQCLNSPPPPPPPPPPAVGTTVYLDKGRRQPMRVICTDAPTVWMVPLPTDIRCTHQGNLYDENGEDKWRV